MKPVLLIFLFSLAGINTHSQVLQLKGTWKFQIGDKSVWSSPTFDDRGWENIYVPSPWEDEGYNGYDGFAWYRKKFDGRLLSKEDNYYLNLGYIDDCDEVYLNGVMIGYSGVMPPKFKTAFNNERRYKLMNEHINFQGENILAIRVFDVTLGGGIIDGDIGIYKSPTSRMLVDLEGMWYFQKTHDQEVQNKQGGWEKILVPSPWEHQVAPKYDGNAWYKRSFDITADLIRRDEELVLILGKIDDFDRTYLNGKLIGETNDHRSYGRSQSFIQQRAYTIPSGLLKAGSNLVEVFVEDMGNTGGIYEGPVGIATRSVYQRYYKLEKKYFWEF